MIDRHTKIVKTVELLRAVSVQNLKERLNVSEVTIRKDLQFLEDQGLILRTHGGARIAQDAGRLLPLQVRERENPELKRRIAERAAQLVREDESVFLDSGSTCRALARTLRDTHRSIRVITVSLEIMNILAECVSVGLYALGGSFRREAGAFVGPSSLINLPNYHIDICFIGTRGFTPAGVFSSQNVIEGQLKKEILARSARRAILADSTKAGVTAFSVFARPENVDILITDADGPFRAPLTAAGIEVLTAQGDSPSEKDPPGTAAPGSTAQGDSPQGDPPSQGAPPAPPAPPAGPCTRGDSPDKKSGPRDGSNA